MIREHTADETVDAFDAWFQGLGNSPIVNVERAILKTFLFWQAQKANEGLEKEADASSPSGA